MVKTGKNQRYMKQGRDAEEKAQDKGGEGSTTRSSFSKCTEVVRDGSGFCSDCGGVRDQQQVAKR
jgi:hypothetical protein